MADHPEPAMRGGLMAVPVAAADLARFAADVAVHSIAFLCAGAAFIALWRLDRCWARLLAFPAAYLALILGFCLAIAACALLFIRKIEPGVYKLSDRRALRWIMADSVIRMFERSFLRGYVKDFAPVRFVLYRLMGARFGRNIMLGGDAKLMDPWALEVGDGSLIAALSVVIAHVVEGDSVVIKPVKIGAHVTLGIRSLILPGVEIGDGAIVGAGAVVTKDTKIPAGEIWAGVPARKIGEVDGRAPRACS